MRGWKVVHNEQAGPAQSLLTSVSRIVPPAVSPSTAVAFTHVSGSKWKTRDTDSRYYSLLVGLLARSSVKTRSKVDVQLPVQFPLAMPDGVTWPGAHHEFIQIGLNFIEFRSTLFTVQLKKPRARWTNAEHTHTRTTRGKATWIGNIEEKGKRSCTLLQWYWRNASISTALPVRDIPCGSQYTRGEGAVC